MTKEEYLKFLKDPAEFLNNPGRFVPELQKSLMLKVDMVNYSPMCFVFGDHFKAAGAGIEFVPDKEGFRNRKLKKHTIRDSKGRDIHVVDFFIQKSEAAITNVYFDYISESSQYENIYGISRASNEIGLRVASIKQDYFRETIKDKAYYLQWGPDKAYVITLGEKTSLFFTDQLTGCGILVFETPHKLILVHHNVQTKFEVDDGSPYFIYRQNAKSHKHNLAELLAIKNQILMNNPNIIDWTVLTSLHYHISGKPASIFGVRSNGRWNVYINSYDGSGYHTKLLHGQSRLKKGK